MEQTTNYLPHILVGIVALLVGWAMGFFDPNARSSKKIKEAEVSANAAIKAAQDKVAQIEAQMAALAATPVTVDDPGLMRIKNEDGTLTLDLDGVRVNTLDLHPDHRKRLIEMLNVIRPWLEHKPASAPAPATMTPPPPKPVAAPVKTAAPAPQSTPSKPAATSAPAANAKKDDMKDDKTATAPTTMVGQINAILQLQIANTRFAEQGVTMIESPSGGVYVYIGLNKFEGINAVPDEEIKAVIRAAIATWEKKYTPGLS